MPIDWAAMVQLGGVTALAMFAILILQKTWEGRLADQAVTQKELEQHRQALMDALKVAAAAQAEVASATRESTAASRELCQEVRSALSVVKRKAPKGDA